MSAGLRRISAGRLSVDRATEGSQKIDGLRRRQPAAVWPVRSGGDYRGGTARRPPKPAAPHWGALSPVLRPFGRS